MITFANKEDLAECAGFFNGEGCTTASKETKQRRGTTVVYKRPKMSIAQTKDGEAMLKRFRGLVGGIGHISLVEQKKTVPYKDRFLKNQPKWVWVASGFEAVQTILGALWPHLSKVKREQAKVVLAECVQNFKDRPENGHKWRTKKLTLHPQGI